MSGSTCLVRYSAREALQNTEKDDRASNGDDSCTDYEYEDHSAKESEHSDVETAVEEETRLQDPQPAERICDSPDVVRRVRGRGRGLGYPSTGIHGALSSYRGTQQSVTVRCFRKKNNFTWDKEPPACGPRPTQDIIRMLAGQGAVLARDTDLVSCIPVSISCACSM